jgi:hypothetical protein
MPTKTGGEEVRPGPRVITTVSTAPWKYLLRAHFTTFRSIRAPPESRRSFASARRPINLLPVSAWGVLVTSLAGERRVPC